MLILEGEFEELVATLAPVCSSWSIVNRGTSQRSMLTPYGNCRNMKVIRGNRMISRTVKLGKWWRGKGGLVGSCWKSSQELGNIIQSHLQLVLCWGFVDGQDWLAGNPVDVPKLDIHRGEPFIFHCVHASSLDLGL